MQPHEAIFLFIAVLVARYLLKEVVGDVAVPLAALLLLGVIYHMKSSKSAGNTSAQRAAQEIATNRESLSAGRDFNDRAPKRRLGGGGARKVGRWADARTMR